MLSVDSIDENENVSIPANQLIDIVKSSTPKATSTKSQFSNTEQVPDKQSMTVGVVSDASTTSSSTSSASSRASEHGAAPHDGGKDPSTAPVGVVNSQIPTGTLIGPMEFFPTVETSKSGSVTKVAPAVGSAVAGTRLRHSGGGASGSALSFNTSGPALGRSVVKERHVQFSPMKGTSAHDSSIRSPSTKTIFAAPVLLAPLLRKRFRSVHANMKVPVPLLEPDVCDARSMPSMHVLPMSLLAAGPLTPSSSLLNGITPIYGAGGPYMPPPLPPVSSIRPLQSPFYIHQSSPFMMQSPYNTLAPLDLSHPSSLPQPYVPSSSTRYADLRIPGNIPELFRPPHLGAAYPMHSESYIPSGLGPYYNSSVPYLPQPNMYPYPPEFNRFPSTHSTQFPPSMSSSVPSSTSLPSNYTNIAAGSVDSLGTNS